MKNVVNYILSAQKKIFVMAFLAVFSSFYTMVWGTDYKLTNIIRDGEYVLGAVRGSYTSYTSQIYTLDTVSDGKYVKGSPTTPSDNTITKTGPRYVWILTTLESGGFILQNKGNSKYFYIHPTNTGNGTAQVQNSPGTIYYITAEADYKTFELSGQKSFTKTSGKRLTYTYGSGYQQKTNTDHSTSTTNGEIYTRIRLYRRYETYTVTYNAGNGTCGTESATEASVDGGVTLPSATPSARAALNGYTFAGWATASVDETKNSPTLYRAGETYYPAEDCTLYAVYAKISNNYRKVTSTDSLSPGNYLVVNTGNNYAMKAEKTSNYYLSRVSVSISNNAISNPANTIIWKVTKKFDTYQFYNANANKWLDNYFGTGHYLDLLSDKGNGYSLTINGDGYAVFSSNNDAGALIYYNHTSEYFRGGDSGGTKNIHLYKQDNTYNSNPIVCGELDDINGAVSWSSPANAEVSWDNIANVDSWTVNYKIHGAGEWTAWDGAQTVYTESETDDKRKVIITDLSCGRYYDFQIVASPAEDYCDKDETLDNSGSGYNSGGFTFWYGTTKTEEDQTECFTQVGTSTTWLTDLWTIPSADQWTYVGEPFWNNDPGKSANLQLSNMPYALNHANNLGTIGTNVMEGAQGYIKINDDSNDANRYVGFIPAGYVLRWGTDENGWSSIPFVAASENIEEENWNTPLHTWTSDNAANFTYVGLKTSSDYVWANRSETRRPVFLKPTSSWDVDGANFAVYYFTSDKTHTGWSAIMTDPDEDGIYEAWIPNDYAYTSVIFVRLNTSGSTGWDNRWNQTVDLALQSDKNVFTIDSGSDNSYTGSWSLYDKKGTFHISANSNTNNWYCHFLPHHVLTYNANGGEGAPATQYVAINADPCQLTVSATEPTRTGYYFLGWSTSSTATSPDDAWDPEDTHTMTEDVTLYAVWEPAVVTFEATTNANWNTTGNWDPNFVPNINTDVILNKPVTVNVTTAQAKSVIINQEGGNNGQLVVDAGQKLIVAGSIQKTTDGETYSATEVNDIIINSDATHGLGALVIGTHDGTNQATVNFTTLSKGTSEDNTSIAQYVGTPFNDETNILHNWYNSWVYGIAYTSNVIGWERVNEGQGMAPFKGYCVFSADGTHHNYWQQGTLVASTNQTLSGLNWQSGVGTANGNNENLLANSWMAPIKISAMESTDFVNTEASIYIFNSTSASAFTSLASNYSTYTIGTAEDDDIIPSMQSFSVFTNAAGGSSVALDYNKIVYQPALSGTVPGPNRAPLREAAEEANKIRLFVHAESGYGDQLYMWERSDFSEAFENGWDGHKLFGESVAPQLFALSPDGDLAINCIPTFEGVQMGFKAGEQDNSYTFTFEYSDEAQPLYLLDINTNTYTQITSDTSYSFTTTDTDVHNRFVLTYNAPSTPTALETTSAVTTGKKVMYDNHLFILHNGRIFSAQGAMIQ